MNEFEKKIIKLSKLKNLSLDLSNNDIDNLQIVEIVDKLKKLKIIKLVLTNNEIRNEDFDE